MSTSDLNRNVFHPNEQAGQKVAYTGTAGTVTFKPGPSAFWCYCSTAAFIKVGGAATTADLPVPANIPVVIPMPKGADTGGTIDVSAIQDATGGNLFVKPLS